MNDGNEGLIALEDPGAETIKVPVLKVFDGDGFLTKLNQPRRNAEIELTVRFGFIDAPEMNQPGGIEAKNFLERLIGNRWVDLVVLTKMDTGEIVDRHGRIVCIPYLTQDSSSPWQPPTRNIELEMILNGWAWVLERYEPDERYLVALEDARRHKRGIWARDDNVHPWEFKKQKYRKARLGLTSSPQPDLFSAPSKARCPTDGCGGHLVERTGRFGAFFGCSNYPNCRFSRSA